jgi:hypothetical protein
MLFTACIIDNQNELLPDYNNGEQLSVGFTLNIPSIGKGGTRSMSDAEESDILTVDVLAFYEDGKGDFRYGYTAAYVGKSISGQRMTVTVKAKDYSSRQQFIVLVNASAELAVAGILPNERLSEAMRKVTCATGNGEWPANNNGSGVLKDIPMYAKTAPQVITASTGSLGDYALVRMVARIDIRLKSTIADFELTEAMLFNYKKAGYLAYDFSSFVDNTDGLGFRATAAAVPEMGNHTGDPILQPTVVYKAGYSADPRGEFLRSIYTYESPAYGEADKLRGFAVVIGGRYGGSPVTTYYRINIKTADDYSGDISSHVLRNHRYDVEIQSVGGAGEDTPTDAYMGTSKLVANIVPWNDAGMPDVGLSQYNLSVSDNRFDILAAGATNTLAITTDYPTGWTATVWADRAGTIPVPNDAETNTPWLSINPASAQYGLNPTDVSLTAPVNTGSGLRTAYIHVKAGNMTCVVTVKQEKLHETINMWLSGSAGNTSRTIEIVSNTPWTVDTPPANATLSATSGNAGTTSLTVSRNTIYGSGSFEVKNTAGMALKTVNIESYYISVDGSFNIPNDLATGNTLTGKVEVQGGSAKWTIVGQKDSWFTAVITSDDKLRLTADQSPGREHRESAITIAHADDPAYQVTVDVIQDFFIPPFDYLVLKFNWQSSDVDVAVRFMGNGAPFDNKPVGWNLNPPGTGNNTLPVMHNGKELLKWGGDAMGGQGETVYFNAPVIHNDNSLQRYITLEVYVNWYSKTNAGGPVKVSMSAYLGGVMEHEGTNFNNKGGETVYSNASTRTIRTGGTDNHLRYANGYNSDSAKQGYERTCTIIYDRVSHAAQITWLAPLSSTQL